MFNQADVSLGFFFQEISLLSVRNSQKKVSVSDSIIPLVYFTLVASVFSYES